MRYRLLVTCVLFTPMIAVATWARSAPDAVTIGVLIPEKGERAPVGRLITQAVEMAVEEANRSGGIGGTPVRLVYEDSGTSADSAVVAARKLVDDRRVVAIVGELFSPFVLASRDVVEQAGVPYLTGGTSPRTTENARWIFRVAASDSVLADLIARYAVEQLKLRKLAVLSSRVGVHNARAELLIRVLRERYGIAPAVRETRNPDDRDFSEQLAKVRAEGVDAIIALGETGEAAPFLKQVKTLGMPAAVIAHRDFGARSALDAAGDAAEGALIVTEYVPALMEPDRQAWAQAWERRYGTDAGIIGAQYHDAVRLLVAAMRAAGTTRAEIKAGLEQLRGFRGVMADYTFDASHNGVHRFLVARIRRGQPVLEAVLEETR